MIAFARAHPAIAAIAVAYALCFLGFAYCIATAQPGPGEP